MITLTPEVQRVISSGRLAYLSTINPDASPQISAVWCGLEGSEIVVGHLMGGQKVINIARDPRVAVTMEADGTNAVGMNNYLVVYGTARLQVGGAPERLQRLAEVYLGPGVRFPPFDDPPDGHVIWISPQRLGGVGPWAS